MKKRHPNAVLLGLVLAALVAAALVAVPGSPIHRKPTLGLDLRGGLEVVLKAVPKQGQRLTSEELSRSRDIMASRVNKLGVSEPDVRTQSPDEIVIQLAGVHDPAAAAAVIGKTAQLQFFNFESDVVGPSRSISGGVVATPSLHDLLVRVQSQARAGTPESVYLFRPRRRIGERKPPANSRYSLVRSTDTRAQLLRPSGGKLPSGDQVLAVPRNMIAVRCAQASGCLGATTPASSYWYLLNYRPNTASGPPELTGNDLNLSGTRADFDAQGRPQVDLSFTGHGARLFQQITKSDWQAGRTAAALAGHGSDPNYVGAYARHFAIVLDGLVESSPYIDYTDNSLSDGISGGGAVINGMQSTHDAKQLALVLQTGALPVKFNQIQRTEVSATLGKNSLREALLAAAIGLSVVAILLLVLYRFLGLVAVIGLAIYVALYYAAILLLNVTLSLPGFAGAILTIGVAADANVVVFERIKEEVRAGKSVRAAISTGYRKGFHTILDANVVTAITALVLFAVATDEVKGFALMLLIGTVISLLTAVAATRALLGVLSGFRWFENPSFMGANAAQRARWLQIDFIGRRHLWFAISGVILAVGAASLVARGLNLGIDFRGGTQMTVRSSVPHTTSQIGTIFARHGLTNAVVQGRGGQNAGGYTQFQIRTTHLSTPQETAIASDLRAHANLTAQPDVNTVSASFGSQIARSAILAIVVSLALIVLYIWRRFGLTFAAPVIVALLHDLAITIGVYSIVGREVSTATVAAVLTILGYSIYDTIIVFDRIRENIPRMRSHPFAVIANISLWETIRRSITTSTITLLPIAALFIFGGATLKDFAFALMIGVISGAYSSIFIATPLLAIWKQREPDYAHRQHATSTPRTLDDERKAERSQTATPPIKDDAAAPAGKTTPTNKAAIAQARRLRRQQQRPRK
jgi:SecD/SecF fusion protein